MVGLCAVTSEYIESCAFEPCEPRTGLNLNATVLTSIQLRFTSDKHETIQSAQVLSTSFRRPPPANRFDISRTARLYVPGTPTYGV